MDGDSVPEEERRETARKVADIVLAELKKSPCATIEALKP